ncbi:hypothetical protein LTR78_003538 [Recurvomyces mirabilis]|uniref:Uncharacterized protein n=1 Tax=Recurvomyces mirabilis TaxID=574656 RepID=A0AAE0WRU5_9PEZI|nr:hypothetical protein LTR78_003538 [Recurvomyces mirabilis]KAK5154431.1 hypothetical protein LTS14_006566 [Recurvomyces mirabilis]
MPPPQQPVARKATIKKAKADFKSRGQPTISTSERKQLLRDVELDRRAWGIEQREKKKAESTLRKKQERERREKDDRARVQMGTQMRCDRFGYKSSQFHLGKFFGAAAGMTEQEGEISVAAVMVEEVEEEDMFGDDGVDDDTLLEALGAPHLRLDAGESESKHAEGESIRSVDEPSPQAVSVFADNSSSNDDMMLDFWNELGSSTQIARELADDDPEPKYQPKAYQTPFPRPEAVNRKERGTVDVVLASRSDSHIFARELMPPPPLPSKVARPNLPIRGLQARQKPPAMEHPPTVAVSGFTMSELEDFVDDDLQLTQVAPG